MITFRATLIGGTTPGAWTFVPVPPELAPDPTGPFGMTPVRATLDGRSWETTIWREKSGRVLLPAPKKVRRGKQAGDEVEVEIAFDWARG